MHVTFWKSWIISIKVLPYLPKGADCHALHCNRCVFKMPQCKCISLHCKNSKLYIYLSNFYSKYLITFNIRQMFTSNISDIGTCIYIYIGTYFQTWHLILRNLKWMFLFRWQIFYSLGKTLATAAHINFYLTYFWSCIFSSVAILMMGIY